MQLRRAVVRQWWFKIIVELWILLEIARSCKNNGKAIKEILSMQRIFCLKTRAIRLYN